MEGNFYALVKTRLFRYGIFSSMKSLYNKYYSEVYKDKSTVHVNHAWVRRLKSSLAISFSSEKKVLDVACGISTLGKLFSSDVYGLDANPQAIRLSKANGIKAKLGNIEKRWNFSSNYFDIVIASHIIEHLVNPDHLMLEAKRVLKNDGMLIVATPNLAAWFNRILLFVGIQPFFTEVSTHDKTLGLKFTRSLTTLRSPLGHLRIFTLGSLIDLFELYDFKILKVASIEFLALPLPLLLLDKLFAHIHSLASNIIIIGKKK